MGLFERSRPEAPPAVVRGAQRAIASLRAPSQSREMLPRGWEFARSQEVDILASVHRTPKAEIVVASKSDESNIHLGSCDFVCRQRNCEDFLALPILEKLLRRDRC